MKKKFIYIIGLLVILLIVLTYQVHIIKVKRATVQANKNPNAISVTKVDSSRLPSGFPVDIPLEAGATVTQNYTALANNQQQSTREFSSTKTLDQNFTVYKNFFSSNGWQIDSSLDQPKLKVISAHKGTSTAQVTIQSDSKTQSTLVSISVVGQVTQ